MSEIRRRRQEMEGVEGAYARRDFVHKQVFDGAVFGTLFFDVFFDVEIKVRLCFGFGVKHVLDHNALSGLHRRDVSGAGRTRRRRRRGAGTCGVREERERIGLSPHTQESSKVKHTQHNTAQHNTEVER